MPPASNLTEKFEAERLRTQEQSQIVQLQGQIDELRRLLKDQTNKYQWAMEQVRKTESAVTQVQSSFERHTEEVAQAVERSRRDFLELRKDVSSSLVKHQDVFETVRQMQAQIQQLAEARKQDRDQSFSWVSRVDELDQRLKTLHASIKENEERHRQLALQITHLREADTETVQEVRRVSEQLEVEKQSLRRQAVEAQQLVSDVRSVLEDHDSRITRIDEIRQNLELFAEQLPQQIADIVIRFPDIDIEIKRVERISTERFLMTQERLENLRHQADEKIGVLQETEEQNTHHHNAWLERIDSWIQELEQRMNHGFENNDVVQRDLLKKILQMEERDFNGIVTIRNAFNHYVEIFQDERSAPASLKPPEA